MKKFSHFLVGVTATLTAVTLFREGITATLEGEPLHHAAKKGYETIVKGLLAAGAAVNKLDSRGQTPLYWAARGGHMGAVKALIKVGAVVDQVDRLKQTPLFQAIERRHKKNIMLLVHPTFKALLSEKYAKNSNKGGGAAADGDQSEDLTERVERLKYQLEKLLSKEDVDEEHAIKFTPSQKALLQWIIGKHAGFQDEGGPTKADLIEKIELDDLKAIMLPEPDRAALSTASKAFNQSLKDLKKSDGLSGLEALPSELIDHMQPYLTQDPLLEKLKNQLTERREEAAATTIQRHVRDRQARRPPASARGGAGAAAQTNPETGADESKETGPGSGPGSGSGR